MCAAAQGPGAVSHAQTQPRFWAEEHALGGRGALHSQQGTDPPTWTSTAWWLHLAKGVFLSNVARWGGAQGTASLPLCQGSGMRPLGVKLA